MSSSCSCLTASTTNPIFSICDCDERKVIDPVETKPITATEPSSNKYSVTLCIKKNNRVTDSYEYAGTFTNTATLLPDAMNSLVEIMGELIRTQGASTYETRTDFDTVIQLDSEANFIAFFATDGNSVNYPNTTNIGLKIEYIAKKMYVVFTTLRDHIELAQESEVVCTANPRLLWSRVYSCLFDFELRYN